MKISPRGIADQRINGIRLPSLLLQLSDQLPTRGSVMASNIRPTAVTKPIKVRTPRTTHPCGIKEIIPSLIAS